MFIKPNTFSQKYYHGRNACPLIMILLRICFCLISVLAETIHDFDFSGLYRYRPISSYSAFFLVHSSEEHPYNISNANDIIYFNFRHGFVRSGYEKCESEQCLLHVVNINGSCKCFGRADLEEYNFYPTGNGIEFNCLFLISLYLFIFHFFPFKIRFWETLIDTLHYSCSVMLTLIRTCGIVTSLLLFFLFEITQILIQF